MPPVTIAIAIVVGAVEDQLGRSRRSKGEQELSFGVEVIRILDRLFRVGDYQADIAMRFVPDTQHPNRPKGGGGETKLNQAQVLFSAKSNHQRS